MQSHQKYDLTLILSVVATILTGVDIRVVIDHDNLTVSSLVSDKLVKLVLRYSSPNIKYYMLGHEKGIIYADAWVDEGRAFGHLTVPREGYQEIANEIESLQKLSERAGHKRGADAYNFLKLDDVKVKE